jgi:hypothetical protein
MRPRSLDLICSGCYAKTFFSTFPALVLEFLPPPPFWQRLRCLLVAAISIPAAIALGLEMKAFNAEAKGNAER